MSENAIELLKQDHERVRNLLERLTQTSTRAQKRRQELLAKIEQEVKVHTKLEEEIFYPAFKDANGKEHDKMFYEAMEEHRAVERMVLPDLKKTDTGSEQFSGRAKVLKELLEHHIEEEESEMFPKAQDSMGEEQLKELGRKMQARKLKLMAAKSK